MPTTWIYSDTQPEALNMEYVMHVAFDFRSAGPRNATSDLRGARVTCRTGEKITVDAPTATAIRTWLHDHVHADAAKDSST